MVSGRTQLRLRVPGINAAIQNESSRAVNVSKSPAHKLDKPNPEHVAPLTEVISPFGMSEKMSSQLPFFPPPPKRYFRFPRPLRTSQKPTNPVSSVTRLCGPPHKI